MAAEDVFEIVTMLINTRKISQKVRYPIFKVSSKTIQSRAVAGAGAVRNIFGSTALLIRSNL